jgi:hypothetical protein
MVEGSLQLYVHGHRRAGAFRTKEASGIYREMWLWGWAQQVGFRLSLPPTTNRRGARFSRFRGAEVADRTSVADVRLDPAGKSRNRNILPLRPSRTHIRLTASCRYRSWLVCDLASWVCHHHS